MYRHFFVFFLFSQFPIRGFSQTEKEKAFLLTVQQVTAKLVAKDSIGLSSFIDPATGVYLVYRNGLYDFLYHKKAVGFTNTSFPNSLFYHKAAYTALRYEALPNYNCERASWSKKGVFTDTTQIHHLLSNTAKSVNEREIEEVSSTTIQYFTTLEKKSRRVIIASNSTTSLIFHLTYIRDQWFLTVIDTVTTDCSA